MWTLLIVFTLLCLISIQTTLLPLFSISGITPDLVLIFAVFCGIHLKGGRGVFAGMISGFLQDCFSGGLLGINTLSKSLMAYTFSRLKEKIMVDGIVPICFFLFASSIFDASLFFCIQILLFKNEWGGSILTAVLGFALYNSILGPVFFAMLIQGKRLLLGKSFPGAI